ncbi:MATE family efflux transporter [Pseudostreptobacillus hongkongensis]|uniref:MATE family efflux transporter n=1 Tax=Pseudostreptobacillus hongkongensis TaxID=1162717 RepID=UPI000833FBB4|nr:MATE family efflux transporter [Pseudostreptobacillus hongkongensis]
MTKNKEMYKRILKIGIPVMLENLVYNLVNFIDNFMVGKENVSLGLGTVAVAGLGIVNQIFFVFMVSLFGLFSGASVLSAQYYGNKDYKNLNKILGFLLIASLLISIPFVLIGIFNPTFLIGLYTNDTNTLIQANNYFRISCLTFPLAGLGMAFSMQLRVINESKYAFYSSFIGLGVNFIGNLLLIPILGVKGAAIATVIARIFALIYMIYIVKKNKFPIASKNIEMFNIEMNLVKSILVISFPTFLHEVFWVLAYNTKMMIYSKTGTVEFASIVTAGTITSILFSMFSGISNASAVIIGNELGANDLIKAKNASIVCIKLMVLLGILSSIILNILAIPLLNLMQVSSILNILTRKVIFVESLFILFKALNLLFVVGILRAGGDIYYGVACDMVSMWIIAVPLVFLARYLNFDIPYMYLFSCISEFVIFFPLILRYRKEKWLKRIVD